MANLKDIQRRISSVQSTQKITSAMKMVSAAKLRRAQDAIQAARPYAERMRDTLNEVAASGVDGSHPLFEPREHKGTLEIVAITSDRGLAGAFNANVMKAVEAHIAEQEKEFDAIALTIVGKKAADYFKRHRSDQISDSREVGPHVNFLEAQQVARRLMARFESGEVDAVVLVYNEFISTMTQSPKLAPLLPFSPAEVEGQEEKLPYEIEPDATKLLVVLVPKAVEVEVFRSLLENQAGEHAARMTAMENATKNTEELIEALTLEFNRARQAAITSELVEIITGAQALD